jgi:general secretion pathway protein L
LRRWGAGALLHNGALFMRNNAAGCARVARAVFLLPTVVLTMSLLVILLATPPRADAAPVAEPAPLAWLLSPDGLSLARQGEAAPALMPRADSVVAVLPAQAVAWHRPVVPRAPANRLRAALGGVLEEQLLSDDEHTHLALAPQPTPGAPVWVAAVDKPWLAAQLAALAAAGLVVDRLVPALAPVLAGDGEADAAVPHGHFFAAAGSSEPEALWLALADADGALCLPLAGGLARAQLPGRVARGTRFSATPAAAAHAERWLGAPVAVRSEAEQALAAVRSRWNLLQFDLTPQHRGSLALGKLGRQLLSPAWRPARLGLAALLGLQLLGLNVMAWQQERALDEKRSAMDALLRSAHPQVRSVLDAPLQMQRETAALRVVAGVPGDEDFEPLLAAAAAAWPDGAAPASQLRFETGRLSLPAAGWAPPLIDQLRSRLLAGGWSLDQAEGRLLIHRAPNRP